MSNNKMTAICYPNAYKPTNADRIHAMTDEELAKFIENASCPDHYTFSRCVESGENCVECWLGWLKQESEDGEI